MTGVEMSQVRMSAAHQIDYRFQTSNFKVRTQNQLNWCNWGFPAHLLMTSLTKMPNPTHISIIDIRTYLRTFLKSFFQSQSVRHDLKMFGVRSRSIIVKSSLRFRNLTISEFDVILTEVTSHPGHVICLLITWPLIWWPQNDVLRTVQNVSFIRLIEFILILIDKKIEWSGS